MDVCSIKGAMRTMGDEGSPFLLKVLRFKRFYKAGGPHRATNLRGSLMVSRLHDTRGYIMSEEADQRNHDLVSRMTAMKPGRLPRFSV